MARARRPLFSLFDSLAHSLGRDIVQINKFGLAEAISLAESTLWRDSLGRYLLLPLAHMCMFVKVHTNDFAGVAGAV